MAPRKCPHYSKTFGGHVGTSYSAPFSSSDQEAIPSPQTSHRVYRAPPPAAPHMPLPMPPPAAPEGAPNAPANRVHPDLLVLLSALYVRYTA